MVHRFGYWIYILIWFFITRWTIWLTSLTKVDGTIRPSNNYESKRSVQSMKTFPTDWETRCGICLHQPSTQGYSPQSELRSTWDVTFPIFITHTHVEFVSLDMSLLCIHISWEIRPQLSNKFSKHSASVYHKVLTNCQNVLCQIRGYLYIVSKCVCFQTVWLSCACQ